MSVAGRRAWSGTERVLVRDNYVSKGAAWCAKRLNRTPGAVRMFALKNGFSLSAADIAKPSSPLIDAQIKRAYTEGRGSATRLAKATGHSLGWISRRAGELGLSMRPSRCSLYTGEEAEFVEAHAHLSRHRIAALMRERGWSRTACSIQKFIDHHRVADNGDFIGSTGLALCLGVSDGTIRSWARTGELIGHARDGTDERGSWRFYALTDVARFVVQHPHRIDLRKVDGPWLIDLIARYGSLGLIDNRDQGRRIVALHEVGKSNVEIATILETSVNAVSVTLSKHRTKIRQQGEAA